ncbi:MAG: hypothetical protein UU25_C0037G0003 [Microgenomates group bacterium GW2011_GWB1_40_9]|uniref:Uncharacterized protein n=1 Tax=Candidatus Zambryskibacteria bacterium RIFCSPHIGHO2_01_FULL_46_30 TaxID=1802739 RepID=A0A1G2T2H6_9BACT|nr:MAG: hypothetical protein UU25_C0037G0003 [Microgenomates group bacterium GW2011_GWB1_40_9]OHA91463.1 MAG: hypothetical protein A2665_00850 [Candidatus Zambryskibacteria bacterium RIFCSPHIGHO2_01_FULL_46_30]
MIVMDKLAQFPQIASRIIKEQELIIGPLAWIEAQKVSDIKIIDQKQGQIDLGGTDPKQVIDRLVARYDRLFGRASREVSKEAAAPLLVSLAPDDIPSSLR